MFYHNSHIVCNDYNLLQISALSRRSSSIAFVSGALDSNLKPFKPETILATACHRCCISSQELAFAQAQ